MGIFFLILLTIIAVGVAFIGFHYNKTPLKIGGIAGAILIIFVDISTISDIIQRSKVYKRTFYYF